MKQGNEKKEKKCFPQLQYDDEPWEAFKIMETQKYISGQ